MVNARDGSGKPFLVLRNQVCFCGTRRKTTKSSPAQNSGFIRLYGLPAWARIPQVPLVACLPSARGPVWLHGPCFFALCSSRVTCRYTTPRKTDLSWLQARQPDVRLHGEMGRSRDLICRPHDCSFWRRAPLNHPAWGTAVFPAYSCILGRSVSTGWAKGPWDWGWLRTRAFHKHRGRRASPPTATYDGPSRAQRPHFPTDTGVERGSTNSAPVPPRIFELASMSKPRRRELSRGLLRDRPKY